MSLQTEKELDKKNVKYGIVRHNFETNRKF